jgi:hypothetical protein
VGRRDRTSRMATRRKRKAKERKPIDENADARLKRILQARRRRGLGVVMLERENGVRVA